MEGAGLVGEILPHEVYLGFPALEDGESVGHILHPLVAFGEGLLQLLIAHLHPYYLQLEVVLVLLQHYPFVQFVLGILGFPQVLLLQFVVVVSVDLSLDQLVSVQVGV